MIWLALALTCAPVAAQSPVERISVSSTGGQGNGQSRYPAISGDARYVVFESDASNLVTGDSNGTTDVFLHDRILATTTRISLTAAGLQASAASTRPVISGNGSRIVFGSYGTLLPGAGVHNCYLLDRIAGSLDIVDRRFGTGNAGTALCHSASIDVAGRRVAFASGDANLIAPGADTNDRIDVFVRDLVTATTTRVNLGPGGVQANNTSSDVRIAAAGGHVIYASDASNLVASDSNAARDIFLSTLAGQTVRVSVGSGNVQPALASREVAATNADGSILAFANASPNLPDWTANADSTLYLRVPSIDATVAISLPLGPALPRDGWNEEPDLSASGRWLVFWSGDRIIPGTSAPGGIHVIDLIEETIAVVSLTPAGDVAFGNHFRPRISADGRGITWFSNVTTLVADDTNGTWDVFYVDNPLWDDTLFADGFE